MILYEHDIITMMKEDLAYFQNLLAHDPENKRFKYRCELLEAVLKEIRKINGLI